MALSLLLGSSEGGERSAHGRWTCAPDLPTVLRESQVAAAGRALSLTDHPHWQEQPEDLPPEDDAEVATLERIPSGWQLTRHSQRFGIAVQRAFGGHEVQLPMPGSVALLCHGDVLWFSLRDTGGKLYPKDGAARLRVELPISSGRDGDSSGDESEELGDTECAVSDGDADCIGTGAAGGFLPVFQRLSQESAERCSQSSQSSAQLTHPLSSQSSCCSGKDRSALASYSRAGAVASHSGAFDCWVRWGQWRSRSPSSWTLTTATTMMMMMHLSQTSRILTFLQGACRAGWTRRIRPRLARVEMTLAPDPTSLLRLLLQSCCRPRWTCRWHAQ